MTNIIIVSGFLGAGKTTLIRNILEGIHADENTVVIENEFGEVSVDSDLLCDTRVEIKEMVSGCICCSLSGDFTKSIGEVVQTFQPAWIIIEPSGVGKLSDVLLACEKASKVVPLQIKQAITVIDCLKYLVYLRNFREFYLDQILHADVVYLRNAKGNAKQHEVLASLQTINPTAVLVDTPLADLTKGALWHQLDSLELLSGQLLRDLKVQAAAKASFRNHAAEEVFQSWGVLLSSPFSEEQMRKILTILAEHGAMHILRAKGIFQDEAGNGYQFSYVPGEWIVTSVSWQQQPKVCVIGTALNKPELELLFAVSHE